MNETAMTPSTLTVDVVSDIVCPWCYIGKHRLEAALATLREAEPSLDVQVRWHPFELNPDVPVEGIERARYLEAKFGGAARAAAIYARVREAGESAGLALDFDAISRQPNTRDAHRLIAWTQARQPQATQALVERLFRAYFVEGRFVGDREELAHLATEAGVPEAAARAFLASGDLAAEVRQAETRAQDLGITGVPFFIFDGRVALSGAHEPATLLDAIGQARGASAP
jgi:predicted DsbA family dithiol-disulfide isomerase